MADGALEVIELPDPELEAQWKQTHGMESFLVDRAGWG